MEETGALFFGLVMGLFIGVVFAYMLANSQLQELAIENGCAYYDTKTAVFTWRAEVKDGK